jgi:hypothetical protein
MIEEYLTLKIKICVILLCDVFYYGRFRKAMRAKNDEGEIKKRERERGYTCLSFQNVSELFDTLTCHEKNYKKVTADEMQINCEVIFAF